MMLISEAFEAYALDRVVFRNQSKQTEEHYDLCRRSFADFVGDIEVGAITFPMLRNWKFELDKTKNAATVRNYLSCFRMVWKYLARKNMPVFDPELIELPRREQPKPVFITSEQVQQLIDSCIRVRSKAIISLLYGSGIRLGELISLDRSDMDSDTFAVRGKNRKVRPCFLDERTKLLLDEYLRTRRDSHPALFISTQHNTPDRSPLRMTPTNIQLILKLARQNAGLIKKVTPHTLRHSFATNLLFNNCDIRYTQAMLGHADIRTTMAYTHIVDERLHEVFKKFHTV